VQFEEYRDGKGNMVWISGFGNRRTWLWKIGDDVMPEVTNEGRYYNFSFDDTAENKLDVYSLPATVGFVMDMFRSRQPQQKSPADVVHEYNSRPRSADEDIKVEDIPF